MPNKINLMLCSEDSKDGYTLNYCNGNVDIVCMLVC